MNSNPSLQKKPEESPSDRQNPEIIIPSESTSKGAPEFQTIEIKETRPPPQRQKEASDKSFRNSTLKPKKATLEALYKFIEEIRTTEQSPEVISLKYLKIYQDNPKYMIDNKELQKFLPNINIKREYRLMKLFGVEALDLTDPKEPEKQLFSLLSKQYIVATMLNSPSYSNLDQKILFAFQMYDRDEDGKICIQDLIDLFSFYGRESQFGLNDTVIEEAAVAIAEEIGIDSDGKINFLNFRRFFEKSEGKKVKINVFQKGKAQRPKKKLPSSLLSEAHIVIDDKSSVNTSQFPPNIRKDAHGLFPARIYSEPVMKHEVSFNLDRQIDHPTRADAISQSKSSE